MPRRIWRSLDVPSSTARPGEGNAYTRQTVDIRETTSPQREQERKAILLSNYYSAMGAAGSFGVTGVPGRSWTVDRAVREGYARVVWVYKAVETIAGNQARLPVVAHDGPDIIPDHPAALLLNGTKCSSIGESGKVYRKRLSQQVLLSPRGSFTETILSRARTPISYTLLPPNRTRVVPAKDGSIDHFEVDPLRPGDPIRKIDADLVRWTREPHPLDPYAGMTPLEAAGLSIEMDHFARLFNRSFLANDGRPGMVIGIKPTDEDSGEMDPREAERIESKFGRGPLEAGRTVVVDGTVSAVDVGGTPRDGSWLSVREAGKDEILVAFGVPESEIGNASGQTFANAGQAKESYWVITQLPHNDTIDDTWAPDALDPSINLTFDVTNVDALARFIRQKREEMRAEVAAGYRTIESYQRNSGPGWFAADDVMDVPGTRALWVPGGVPIAANPGDQEDVSKLTPIGAGAQAAASRGGAAGQPPGGPGGMGAAAAGARGGVTPAGGAGMDTSLALPPISGIKAAPRGRRLRALNGTKVVSSDDEEDHRARDAAAGTLEALLHAIANRLTEVTVAKVAGRQGRQGTRHWRPKPGEPLSTKALNVDAVVDPQQWHDQALAAAMQVLGPAGSQVGDQWRTLLAQEGIDVPDTEQAPEDEQPPPSAIPPSHSPDAHPVLDAAIILAARWLARAAASKAEDLKGKISAAEADELDRINREGRTLAVDGGPDSVAPIIQAIREWQAGPDGDTGLASWAKSRAEAATTGALGGVTAGIMRNLPADRVKVTQTWHTRKDDRVRDAHRLAEGQQVGADEPFIVGGEPLRYPGDPAGSPGNIINCRCHTTHDLEILPESKALVRTAAGAERFKVPIGSTIEAHRKVTHGRPHTLPGNVEAMAWGYSREEDLAAAVPFMLNGLGGRDEHGRHKPGTSEPYAHFVTGDDRVEAKRQVAADLAERMSDVSDSDLLGPDAADAANPDVLWHVDMDSGQWERVTDPKRAAELRGFGLDDRTDVGGPAMVKRLRQRAVSDLVHQWAETSNDHSPGSLAIQQVVAEEFGLDNSHEWPVDDDTQSQVDAILEFHRPKLAGFVHAQYALTQERLQQAGLDTVNLYRGMSWPSSADVPEWAKGLRGSVDSITVPLRPLSSFTADGEIAVQFAQGAFDGDVSSDEFDTASLVLSATVPRERILATPRTGVGCLGEWEFVVLGGSGDFSAVAQGISGGEDDEEQLSDHDVGWMSPSTFNESEVLRALALNPDPRRRRELMDRASALGMEIKALPEPVSTGTSSGPASGPSPADVRNEDWIKTLGWDIGDYDEQPVKDLTTLAAVLGVSEPEAADWLRTMPAGEAAPPALRKAAGLEAKGFDPDEPRQHGRWVHVPTIETTDYEGRVGDLSHITRVQRGTLPTSELADLQGVKGEVPGEHRNRRGEKWDEFVDDVRRNGVQNPIFITVDPGEEPKISEGNHRRDAAVEAGRPDVPVLIRYYGHAEDEGRHMDAREPGPGEAKAVAAGVEHEVWTAEEAAKHPRGAHGKFAHVWMRTMHQASQRNPAQVISDVLSGGTEPTITWKRHADGFVSDDGNYYIERRVSGSRLYRRSEWTQGAHDDVEITDGPFKYGVLVASSPSIADLRAKADKDAAEAYPVSKPDGEGDGSVRGDRGGQLAEGRAGSVRADQGQAGVLPGVGGRGAAPDRRGDGREPGSGGGDVRAAGEAAGSGAGAGGGVGQPGVADAAAAPDRGAVTADRDSGAGAGDAGGSGLPAGDERLSGRGDGVREPAGAAGGPDDGVVTESDQPVADPNALPGAIGGDAFKPTSMDDLAPAGKVAKLKANIEALRTLRMLQRENRPATPEEQQTLARWAGWGGLPDVFDPDKPMYREYHAEVASLLSPAEEREARRNTLNAHYTDARVVEQVWRAVGELGFDGGRVLEPGSGSGTFIGFAPDKAAMVGVELDSTTAAISQFLYPNAQIRNESFADTNVPDGSFDATVGNVPFGKFALTDSRHNPTGESIHNHFILKSLALTRPGGIVAVLTSRYTLDSENERARRLMADKADLIGAVRLPSGSHQRASGTDVIEDILIFRVRKPGEKPQGDQSWIHSTKRDIDGQTIPVNDYFTEHPEDVLGEVHAEKGRFGTGDLIVRGDRDMADLPAAMDRIVASAKEDGLTATPSKAEPLPDLITPDAGRHEGHIRAEADGTFTQARGGASRPKDVPAAQADELRQLTGLRDTLAKLLTAEASTHEDTPQIEALRGALNQLYDGYVEKYGPINRFTLTKSGARKRPAQGDFRSDPMSASVRALEKFDPVTQTAEKADVFTKRAVAPRELRTTADNPADALTLSMETYGDVNLPAIAKMLGVDEADVRQQLGNLVFEQPPLTAEEQAAAEDAQSLARMGDIASADAVDLSSVGESVRQAGALEPASAYLSGNVRRKLAAARAAAAHDPRFQANVDALEKVVPTDLGPTEIDGRLGASWIGPDVIEQFLRELLNERQPRYGRTNNKVQVAHSGGAIWTVVAPRKGILATQEWGTPDRPCPELVQSLLEQRPIKVTREVTMPDGRTKNVPDLEATLAAQAKADELQAKFSEWLWEDPDRARRLQATYNDRFNAIVLRQYGADPDREWPGMAASWKPFDHVKAAAERIVQEPTVLLAHVVGAGKTSEMTMGTQELRRLGLARKPAIVIPNHMLEQFSREYLEIYPQAKILAAGTEDLRGDKRREFVARAATGDWDAVILTQSAFEAIPMSREQQQAYIDREMATMRAQLAAAQADGEQSNAQKRTVKKMENALLRAEEALKKKLDKQKDVGVSFEQTGIDYLMVDEAHMYSNLRTLSNIQGAGTMGSNRATDLHMKLEYLRANTTSGRVATFATGTPIRNTVTQAYVMQKFLRPDLLEEAGIFTFDQWAATFGEVVDEMELKPEGKGFRQTQRFARFRNVPELLRLFQMFADVKMAEDLDLPTPDLAGGKPETVVVPASDELRAYVNELGDRADAVRAREVDPTEDNMLKISGDGRKAALSMRLVGQEHQPGKIEAAADRIAAIHRTNADRLYGDDERPGALQIVFLDMGTPKGAKQKADDGDEDEDVAGSIDDSPDIDWNAYDALKGELVARGMDPDSIRYIHEAKNDAEKAEMFAAARNGRISVLIGSSEKMGVGTNIQKRAIALHHLDAPWRPADVEQRDGRILRQGNLNPEIQILRYVTEHSFDAYMWQTLERKAKFIHQIMRGRLDVREIEDIGDTALSAAEAKAIATGNPDVLEKARTDEAVVKLERLERAHGRQQTNMQTELTRYTNALPQWEQDADAYDRAIEKRTDTRGDKFAMTVGGRTYATRTEAADAVVEALEAASNDYSYNAPPRVIGTLGGHEVVSTVGYDSNSRRVLRVGFAGVPGTVTEIKPHEIGQVGPGIISRLENGLTAFEGKRDRLRAAAEQGRGEIERINARLGQPFAGAPELAGLRVKSQQLKERLEAAAAAEERAKQGASGDVGKEWGTGPIEE